MRYTGVIPKTMSFIKRVKRGLSSSEYSFGQNDPSFYTYRADDSTELPSGIGKLNFNYEKLNFI